MQERQLYATNELRASREAKGFTQTEMAEALSLILNKKISLSSYQKWEQGINSVKLEVAIKIARELGRGVKELWEGK